jgi:hypothetical protein
VAQRDVDPQVVDRIADDARLEADRETLHLRRPADLLDVGAGHALEPHGLPDAARARIPDRVRLALPVLLAARLGQLVRVVFGEHGHRLPARGSSMVGDVGPERRVPALVALPQAGR